MTEFVEICGVKFKLISMFGSRIRLDIENVRIDGLENIEWGDFTERVKQVYFRNCDILSIVGLQKLENMQDLNFSKCNIDCNPEISNFVNLMNFNIVDSLIANEYSLLLNNSNLSRIAITRTKGITDMRFLGDLPKLQSLDIKHTTLKHIRNLEKTKSLRYLNLDDNKITSYDELELIIKQNPLLKKVNLLMNPLEEAKDIEGVLIWDRSGSRYTYKNLHPTVKLSMPKIAPKPEPKPKPKPYVVSDGPTNCKECGKTIPPSQDYYPKHALKANHVHLKFRVKLAKMEEKVRIRVVSDGHYLRETFQYFRYETRGLSHRFLQGPICENCSKKFLHDYTKILGKIRTRGTKNELRKTLDAAQNRIVKLSKKWNC